MKRYIIEQFTSRNTSFNRDIYAVNRLSAKSKAKKISLGVHFPVTIHADDNSYVKFDQGILVEHSILPF